MFDKTACLEAEDLEEAFKRAQHGFSPGESPWHESGYVVAVFNSEKVRSLSTGDVLRDTTEDQFYRVDRFGFTELPNPNTTS